MMVQKLSIAFSATCLIACLLITGLWVRSYERLDGISGPTSDGLGFQVYSTHGWMVFSHGSPAGPTEDNPWELNVGCDSSQDGPEACNDAFRGFDILREPCVTRRCIPLWFPVLLSATLATAPWIRWQFSLRMMLIAVTLFAVGLAVYAASR
jgi:hypothetical protein